MTLNIFVHIKIIARNVLFATLTTEKHTHFMRIYYTRDTVWFFFTIMDACIAVEREVDKVLSKFENVRHNYSEGLQELIDSLESIKSDLQTNDTNDGKVNLSYS